MSTWENRGYVEVVAVRPPPSKSARKDPIVKANVPCPEWPWAEDKNNPENKSDKNP